jgi:hypothetical protein
VRIAGIAVVMVMATAAIATAALLTAAGHFGIRQFVTVDSLHNQILRWLDKQLHVDRLAPSRFMNCIPVCRHFQTAYNSREQMLRRLFSAVNTKLHKTTTNTYSAS